MAKQGPGGLLAQMRAIGSRPGPKCSIVAVLAKLDADDATDLRTALNDPSITSAAIADVLIANGHRIGRDAAARHRRGVCACGSTR